MAQASSFTNIKNLYFLVDRNFNVLFNSCTSDTERQLLRQLYVIARDNFWEARNRIFIENDPIVTSMNSQLSAINKKITAMITSYQTAEDILNAISSGVKLASSLIVIGSNQGTPA